MQNQANRPTMLGETSGSMEAVKHTPRPFKCDVRDQGSSGRDAYVAIIGGDGSFIGHVMCNDGRLNPLPYAGNAAFFIAAPDMLAALKLARECIAYCRKNHNDAQTGEGFPVEIILDAAIAKAEGR